MFKKMNLFSKTEMKILFFLLEHDNEMYEREIAKKAKVSVGSANTALKKFAKMQFLESRRVGRMLFYKRNDRSATIRQLKTARVVEFIEKEFLKKIKPFSKKVILFGSCAEGANTAESDIDLFILSNKKNEVFKMLSSYSKISSIVLSSIEYSELSKKDKPLYDRINRGITIWSERDER